MPQLLALEWNGAEARLVLATGRGEQVVIEQAFAVELRPRSDEGEKSAVDIGGRLASALGARGIGKVETLVAIGRTNIELRQLSLPPAPDDELPDLVRFQAMREFNELADDWLLDYVPLSDSPDEPRTVLAAAVGPELVSQIDQTCEKAGLKPKRLVLRACAAAELLARAQSARQSELRLLVDLLSDEADLTVINEGRVIFMRTTRIGGDPPQPLVLLGEIRRTIAAVQNQLGGRMVDSIVLCGGGSQLADLAKLIETELVVRTELFDPFEGLQLGRELQEGLPDHPGRFTPLLGMLMTEFDRRPHAVDFLHPRRRPPPPSKWRRYSIPAAAVAVLLLSYFGWCQWDYYSVSRDVTDLRTKSSNLVKQANKAEKRKAVALEVEKWTSNDFDWLDILYDRHTTFPPAEDAMLKQIILQSTSLSAGEIQLDGYVRSTDVLSKIESKKSNEDASVKPYAWHFNATLPIRSETPIVKKTAPPPKKPASPNSAATGSNKEPSK
jgi:Tfp pilus assembly PilM family ATPase